MAEELKLSESEELAALISPIVNIVDTVLVAREDLIPLMERALAQMEETASTLEALPFPATLNKAHERKIMTNFFRAILVLFKTRKQEIEDLKERKPFADGSEILKLMGIT